MKHRLQVTTQGVQARRTKTVAMAYGSLSLSTNGNSLVEICADTFSGEGKTYRERDNILINITFPHADMPLWTGTAENLREMILRDLTRANIHPPADQETPADELHTAKIAAKKFRYKDKSGRLAKATLTGAQLLNWNNTADYDGVLLFDFIRDASEDDTWEDEANYLEKL